MHCFKFLLLFPFYVLDRDTDLLVLAVFGVTLADTPCLDSKESCKSKLAGSHYGQEEGAYGGCWALK